MIRNCFRVYLSSGACPWIHWKSGWPQSARGPLTHAIVFCSANRKLPKITCVALSRSQDQDRPESGVQVPYPELARNVGPRYFSTFDEVRTRAIDAPQRLGMCRPFAGTTLRSFLDRITDQPCLVSPHRFSHLIKPNSWSETSQDQPKAQCKNLAYKNRSFAAWSSSGERVCFNLVTQDMQA